jgi:hypothetical protein
MMGELQMQGTSQERRAAIRELAARKARELPLLPSGFWFHDDVRDNFYYAIHLFAACVGQDVKKAGCGEADRQAFRLAADMIGKVLKLQVQEEVDPMYGHWPLRLSDNPAESKPNSLPVELMGCLLIYFYHTYLQELPPSRSANDRRHAGSFMESARGLLFERRLGWRPLPAMAA